MRYRRRGGDEVRVRFRSQRICSVVVLSLLRYHNGSSSIIQYAVSLPLTQLSNKQYYGHSSMQQQHQIQNLQRPSDASKLSSSSHVRSTFSRNNLHYNSFTTAKRERPICNDRTIIGDGDPDDSKQLHKQPMSTDMMFMSAAGTLLTIGVILTLAGNDIELDDFSQNIVVAATEGTDAAAPSATQYFATLFQQRMIKSLEIAGTNIVDATVPLTASDIVSVAIGESIAGVIAASLSYIASNLFVGFVENQQQQNENVSSTDVSTTIRTDGSGRNSYGNLFPTSSTSSGIVKMSDVMADTDYIITNVAAREILSSSLSFVSPIVQTLIATGVAIIPYSIVKYNAQRQQQKEKLRQQQLMQQLIRDEEQVRRQQVNNIQLGNIWKNFLSSTSNSISTPIALIDKRMVRQPVAVGSSQFKFLSSSRPVNLVDASTSSSSTELTIVQLDWVEIFADIVKWLQFDVLCADFGNGQLLGSVQVFRTFVAESMLSPEQYVSLLVGTECAIFGIITAITSQVYSDVLYTYFKLGAETKQVRIKNRTELEWFTIYFSKVIYCAILFGIYGGLKEPTESIVLAVGSGGADNCYGSINYQYCIDTFVANNPVGPTPEAQLRSLVTAGISFWNNHFQWLSYQPFSGP